MRECSRPLSDVLYYIIILLSLIVKLTFPVELSIEEFAFITRAIVEDIHPMTRHDILLPVSRILVSSGPSIHAIAVLVSRFAFKSSLVVVPVAEVALHSCLLLHFCLKLIKSKGITDGLLNVGQ